MAALHENDEMLDTKAVAAWLGIAPITIAKGRCTGLGPPYVRLTPKAIRYRKSDVEKWLNEQTFSNTAQYETGAEQKLAAV